VPFEHKIKTHVLVLVPFRSRRRAHFVSGAVGFMCALGDQSWPATTCNSIPSCSAPRVNLATMVAVTLPAMPTLKWLPRTPLRPIQPFGRFARGKDPRAAVIELLAIIRNLIHENQALREAASPGFAR
jgi:hypothetical protein